MNLKTLVLNADYSPLYLVTAQRAFTLWWKDRVSLIHSYENETLNSPSASFEVPSVVRIKNYVKIPHKSVSLTRKNIYKRDNYTCVYCGSGNNLTIDHVVPQSKGGKNTWKNLVTACKTCNQEKADSIIDTDDIDIYRPTFFSIFKNAEIQESWEPYIF